MKKLMISSLIMCIANFSIISGIVVVFKHIINIEFHIEESLLILALCIFLVSAILIARLL